MKKGRIIDISVVTIIILVLIAITVPTFIKSRNASCQNGCINNLRMIDSAKEQWALANHKTNGEEVVILRANEYIKGNTTPICPENGAYKYNVIGKNPECSGVTSNKFGPVIPHKLPE